MASRRQSQAKHSRRHPNPEKLRETFFESKTSEQGILNVWSLLWNNTVEEIGNSEETPLEDSEVLDILDRKEKVWHQFARITNLTIARKPKEEYPDEVRKDGFAEGIKFILPDVHKKWKGD